MSALGQKRTPALQKGMSGLPPKADMWGATSEVGQGPIAMMDLPRRETQPRRPLITAMSIFVMPELQRSCDMRNIDVGQRISNLRDKRGQSVNAFPTFVTNEDKLNERPSSALATDT